MVYKRHHIAKTKSYPQVLCMHLPSLKEHSFRTSFCRLLHLEQESAIATHELMFCM